MNGVTLISWTSLKVVAVIETHLITVTRRYRAPPSVERAQASHDRGRD
jgi:hypothetical protein